MSLMFSPVILTGVYAAEAAARKSKGMPLQIIIPFTVLMIPVFFYVLMWLAPKLEKKFGSQKESPETK